MTTKAKSNIELIRNRPLDKFSHLGEYRGPKGGIWLPGARPRRLKVRIVNEKQERSHLMRWVLKWVIAIPLSVTSLWWMFALVRELFLFTG